MENNVFADLLHSSFFSFLVGLGLDLSVIFLGLSVLFSRIDKYERARKMAEELEEIMQSDDIITAEKESNIPQCSTSKETDS